MENESAVFLEAMEHLDRGDLTAARRVADRAVAEAMQRHGADSPEAAEAEFDLAKLLIASSDLVGAAAALSRAWAVPASGEAGLKDRLTYNMNLGEVLQRLGRLEEAERVLRDGLSARETFYGPQHPGVAYGLEPLADVLRQRGSLEEALTLIERAAGILRQAGHDRMAPVLAVRASIARGLGRAAFEATETLPEPLFDTLVSETLGRADREDASIFVEVLQELEQLVRARRGPQDEWLLQIAATLTTVAAEAGDQPLRQRSFQWLVEELGTRGRLEEQLGAVLGLALAQSDEGDPAAEESYRQALLLAEPRGPEARSQVLRNFGLFLSDSQRRGEAAPLLEEAVECARQAGDEINEGRALVALGIFRQHDGELEPARTLLESALARLPASHPDTLYARSHLQAIEAGGGCGCGNMNHAIGEALKAMVEDQVPGDLLRNISVRFDGDGTPQIEVELSRQPDAAELEHLETVVRGATATLQRRIKDRGMN